MLLLLLLLLRRRRRRNLETFRTRTKRKATNGNHICVCMCAFYSLEGGWGRGGGRERERISFPPLREVKQDLSLLPLYFSLPVKYIDFCVWLYVINKLLFCSIFLLACIVPIWTNYYSDCHFYHWPSSLWTGTMCLFLTLLGIWCGHILFRLRYHLSSLQVVFHGEQAHVQLWLPSSIDCTTKDRYVTVCWSEWQLLACWLELLACWPVWPMLASWS